MGGACGDFEEDAYEVSNIVARTNLILALSNTFLPSCAVGQSLKLDSLCYVSKPVQHYHLIKNRFRKCRCAEMTAAVEGDKGRKSGAGMLCSSLLGAFLMALFGMCIHFAVECSKKYGVFINILYIL